MTGDLIRRLTEEGEREDDLQDLQDGERDTWRRLDEIIAEAFAPMGADNEEEPKDVA